MRTYFDIDVEKKLMKLNKKELIQLLYVYASEHVWEDVDMENDVLEKSREVKKTLIEFNR